jgi:hypothetical protein
MLRHGKLIILMTLGMSLTAGAGWAAESPEVAGPALVGEEYPDPDAVFAEYGIRLLAGDGGIRFVGANSDVNCPAGQIQVEGVFSEHPFLLIYCFEVVAETGVLSVEIPNALGVRGGDIPVKVTASEFGRMESYDVDPHGRVLVDHGPETIPQAVVVELRADRSWAKDEPVYEVARPELVGDPISGAEEVFAEYGIRLLAGDGGIRFVGANSGVNCPAGQIQVEGVFLERPSLLRYCFEVVAEAGVLSLEIPNASVVRGGDIPVRVTASEFGRMESYDVDPRDWVSVDHSIPGDLPQATVVELRVGD